MRHPIRSPCTCTVQCSSIQSEVGSPSSIHVYTAILTAVANVLRVRAQVVVERAPSCRCQLHGGDIISLVRSYDAEFWSEIPTWIRKRDRARNIRIYFGSETPLPQPRAWWPNPNTYQNYYLLTRKRRKHEVSHFCNFFYYNITILVLRLVYAKSTIQARPYRLQWHRIE